MAVSHKISLEKRMRAVVAALRKTKAVKTIILFGSYARGEQKPLSDIDICVITERDIPDALKTHIASFASDGVEISFFWDLPPFIRYNALRDGKILLNRDKKFTHNAVVATMSEYLDFQHIIKRNLARAFGA